MLRRPRLGGVIVLTLLMLLLLPAALLAVDFPNKPINLIVPYAAAGAIPAADLAWGKEPFGWPRRTPASSRKKIAAPRFLARRRSIGYVSCSHRTTASGSRSSACRKGFCGVMPSAARSRPTVVTDAPSAVRERGRNSACQ